MTEPDVALTDYALAIECALFAYLVRRREHALFFGSAAVASLLRATRRCYSPRPWRGASPSRPPRRLRPTASSRCSSPRISARRWVSISRPPCSCWSSCPSRMHARGSGASWSRLQGSASCSSQPGCNRRGSRCTPPTSITTRCTISCRRWPCGSSFLACGGSMLTRREFLEVGATAGTAIALAPYGCAGERSAPGVVVNDIHSQLNSTRVDRVGKPASGDAVVQLVQSARQEGRPLSIAGGRHAMGGQQRAASRPGAPG